MFPLWVVDHASLNILPALGHFIGNELIVEQSIEDVRHVCVIVADKGFLYTLHGKMM